jgi:DNA invertase Pin-like site-specific DNA recombinase
MLTVLGGLAEFERELIKAGQPKAAQGPRRGGVRLGRKPKLTHHQIAEIRRRKLAVESVRELGRSYNVSPNTISRIQIGGA